ncbi:MAG: hypothetical protein ACKN9K_30620, partial [Dolichospermum sp.]
MFGIESDEFRQTQIKLKLDIDLILANITNHPWQSRVSLSNKESEWFLDIQKPENDTNVTFAMRDKGIPHKLLTELISSNITSLIFSKKK